jgi:phospholipase D1/2
LAKARSKKLVWSLAVGALLLIAIALLWKFTPAREFLQPERMARRLETIEKFRWAPFIFVGAYLVGGLVMFPVTVLGAVSAIVFPPYKAVMVSFTGVMLSAALHHVLGARFIRGRAQKALGSTMKKLDSALTDRGVVTIAAIRMIPIAPFTLVNLAAGGLGVGLRDYLLGTALGLAPSITMICIFGRQVRAFWRDPSGTGVLLIVVVCVAWLGMAVGLQRLIAHHKGQNHPASSDSQRRTKRSEA